MLRGERIESTEGDRGSGDWPLQGRRQRHSSPPRPSPTTPPPPPTPLSTLQGNIIGTCAALEIGLSLEEYVSMPLPPLTEDCYAMRAMTGRAELATQGPGSLEELEGGPD